MHQIGNGGQKYCSGGDNEMRSFTCSWNLLLDNKTSADQQSLTL